MDVANIGFRADTSELKEAKASLEALAPAAKTAQTASETLAKSSDNVAKSANNVAVAAAKGAAAVKNEAAAAAAGVAANNNLAASVSKAAVANDNLAKSSGNISYQIRGVAQQLSQVTQQVQAGTSFFSALAIQLPDIAGGFGTVGIAIGILSGIALTFFGNWLAKSGEMKMTLQEQNDLIRELAEAWGTGIPAIDEYIRKIDQLKSTTESAATAKFLTAETIAPTAEKVEELNIELVDLRSKLQDAGAEAEVITALNDAFQNLRDKVAEGKSTQTDFNNVIEATKPASDMGISGVDSFIASLGRLMGAALAATGQVKALNAAIGAASSKALNDPRTWRGRGNDAGDMYGDQRPIQGTSDPNLPMDGPTIGFRPSDLLDAKARGYVRPKKAGGGKTSGEKYSDILNGAERQLSTLKAQQAALGLSTEAAAKLKYETELLNKAQQGNITLNDTQKAKLSELAGQMAQTEAATKKQAEALEFSKSATKGFLSDLVGGLREGKSLWESFGDAAMNVLDKIVDKLLNQVVDALFETNSAIGGGKSGGGILGGIGKFFTSLFSANGNVFDGGRAMAFASGGAFTNGVVSRPTAFNLGVMGEAGPEAIMPLSRGPDGSLGVSMHAANANQRGGVTLAPQTVNQFTLTGAISEETVVARIQAAAEKTKQDTQREMVGWLEQYNRDGAFS